MIDPDGSRTVLDIVLSNIPDGATLNAGTYNQADNTWVLNQSELAGLILTVPSSVSDSFNITASVSASDSISAEIIVDTDIAEVRIPDDSSIAMDNMLYGDSNDALMGIAGETDLFEIGGDNVIISNFDANEDVLGISELISSDEAVDASSLAEYLDITFVDADNDGSVDDTQIVIDSNGESDSGGDLTTILILDEQLNQNELDDENTDYNNH